MMGFLEGKDRRGSPVTIVRGSDSKAHQVPLVHLGSLAIIKGLVKKVIQASQDQEAELEYPVLLVEEDFQALPDKRESRIPMTIKG